MLQQEHDLHVTGMPDLAMFMCVRTIANTDRFGDTHLLGEGKPGLISAAAHLAAALLAGMGLRPPLEGGATRGVRGREAAFRVAAEKGSTHFMSGTYLQASCQLSAGRQIHNNNG